MTPILPHEANAASSKESKGDTTSYLWHLRLGHIGYGGLNDMVKKSYGTGLDIKSVKQWEICSRQTDAYELHEGFAGSSKTSA